MANEFTREDPRVTFVRLTPKEFVRFPMTSKKAYFGVLMEHLKEI
jgi:hypothetical protein